MTTVRNGLLIGTSIEGQYLGDDARYSYQFIQVCVLYLTFGESFTHEQVIMIRIVFM